MLKVTTSLLDHQKKSWAVLLRVLCAGALALALVLA
jgi:hypothetical protein